MKMLPKDKALYIRVGAVLAVLTVLIAGVVGYKAMRSWFVSTVSADVDKKIGMIEHQLTQKQQGIDEIADKKIEELELKLTQTLQRLDELANKQTQVCESAKEIRKSYVKERVRREIADEVLKNHLGAE